MTLFMSGNGRISDNVIRANGMEVSYEGISEYN